MAYRFLGLSVLMLAATHVGAQEPKTKSEVLPHYPVQIAWVDEGERGFLYRRFPGGQRLYVYDRDTPGKSNCTGGCASAWPPVPAPPGAKPVGFWSVIVRNDGSRQWALRGKPVYTRFHDSPASPGGDGVDGVWHLIPYISRERVAACAAAPETC